MTLTELLKWAVSFTELSDVTIGIENGEPYADVPGFGRYAYPDTIS